MNRSTPEENREDESLASADNALAIVGVGASAGGLEAFKLLLKALPDDTGMAFVLVQHLDPDHESMMVDLLSNSTRMTVVATQDEQTVEADHVYMIAPNQSLRISRGQLHLDKPIHERGRRMSIDNFFRSLAEDQGQRAIGIVLSGTGSDGSAGLKAIKAAGGLTIAQSADDAAYSGMPQAAKDAGVADIVQNIADMPASLQRFVTHPYLKPSRSGEHSVEPVPVVEEENEFNSILSVLHNRLDVDFRHYKTGTLERRISRRMGLLHLRGMADYLELLRNSIEEAKLLHDDFLIGVTDFFRDKEAFSTLETHVLEPLIEHSTKEPIRIWVPGCTSGEEAYTLAMLLHEAMVSVDRRPEIQIFASDIDESALRVARTGIYPLANVSNVSQARLDKHFERIDNDCVRVIRPIRQMVVFARQNLTADPPFSRLDLVSCRNVMIYLQQPVQDKLMSLFHFSLKKDAHLFLGTAESVGRHTELFSRVADKSAHLYQRRCDKRLVSELPPSLDIGSRTGVKEASARASAGIHEPRIAELASRWLLEEFAPATVVLDGEDQVVFQVGPVEHYLAMSYGEPTRNLFDRLREGLVGRLRETVHSVRMTQRRSTIAKARMCISGRYEGVTISVRPVNAQFKQKRRSMVMVSFQPSDKAPDIAIDTASEPKLDSQDISLADTSEHEATNTSNSVVKSAQVVDDGDSLVNLLESELRYTRENLQSITEEMESANQELKASNEEVLSVNEELQSTNEELETSKEELQSLNEELTTLNSQLQEKLEEYEEANNDITNLLNSADLAVLFLDSKLRIKRFTPAATSLFKLIDSDLGRPLAYLDGQLEDPQLLSDAQNVAKSLVPAKTEVPSRDGNWYVRRTLPYRTQDHRINGVVVTYSDITHLRQSQQLAYERLSQLDALYQYADIGIAYHDSRGRFRSLNNLMSTINGVPVEAHVGKRASDVLPEPIGSHVNSLLQQVVDTGKPIVDLALRAATSAEPGIIKDWQASYFPTHEQGDSEHANGKRMVTGVSVLVREVTAEQLAVRCQNVSRTLTSSLNHARDLVDGLINVLPAFDTDFDATCAGIWYPDETGEMQLAHWHARDHVDVCHDMLLSTRHVGAGGMVREVASDVKPRWISAPSDWPGYQSMMDQVPSGTAFAIPFDSGFADRPRAVLLVFLQNNLGAHSVSDAMLERMARDLSQFVQRMQVEQALRMQERELRALTSHLPVIVTRYAADGTVSFVNPAVTAMIGSKPEDLIGKSITALGFSSELRMMIVDSLDDVRVSSEPNTLNFSYDTPDGRRYYQATHVPEFDAEDELVSFLSVTVDVTDRKRVESALAERERTLQHTLDEVDTLYKNLPLGLCVLDVKQRITRINAFMLKMAGVNSGSAMKAPLAEVFPDIAEQLSQCIDRLFDSGEPVIDCEMHDQLVSGSRQRAWSVSLLPLKDAQGTVQNVSCAMRDITNSKLTTQRLAARAAISTVLTHADYGDATLNNVLQLLVSHLSVDAATLWVLTEDDEPTLSCNAYQLSADYNELGAVPLLQTYLDQTLFPVGKGLVGRVFHTGKSASLMAGNVRNDLGVLHRETGANLQTALALPVVDEHVICVIALYSRSEINVGEAYLTTLESIGRDIGYAHRRHRDASELEAARAEAERANQTKSEFLANVSHELRSPLTAILGYADILESRLPDEEDLHSVQTIRSNGKHLLTILNDILDLAKIEANKLTVEADTVRMQDLLGELRLFMSQPLEDKTLQLGLKVEGKVPETINCDILRLRQILYNLINNAIKFTEEGSVTLRVSVQQFPETELRFDVIDTGIGMSSEQQSDLFMPFNQADGSHARRFGGTGLGLTISRRLAGLMKGSIEVESETDRGSTFSLRLPFQNAPDVKFVDIVYEQKVVRELPSTTTIVHGRVLVVDDLADIRLMIKSFLSKAGAVVDLAENGKQALEQLRLAREHNELPDAVVMDMQMPVMDGYEATSCLRAEGIAVPILALTANAMKGERERCVEVGCTDYLSKPVEGREVVQKVQNLIRGDSTTRTVPDSHVMVVDDNTTITRMLAKVLDKAGYRVSVAHKGVAALQMLADDLPDLMLLDVGLPDIDGFEVAQRIHKEWAESRPTLIAFSGADGTDDDFVSKGFDHRLLKPVEVAELQRLLARCLQR